MESIEQTFDGNASWGKRVSCTVSRNGDLISNMYLRFSPGANTTGNTGPAGYNLIKTATLEIGGQQIDKHYGHWMNVWSMLSTPAGQVSNLNQMVHGNTDLTSAGPLANVMYVPFQFWFCRNPGLALPLIALQYHEVKLVVELNTGTNVQEAETEFTSAPTLFVDYIYLDTDERRRFAQVSHEYLIEQLQFTGDETGGTTNKKFQLNFNHPVKELVWCSFENADKAQTLVLGGASPTNVRLQLNGHDRFSERDGMYFTHVQPWQHHTSSPAAHGNGNVSVYSFALKPEEHQPSGTCNMSRIDTAVLNMNCGNDKTLRIYAVNYNVLRIMSGMGGLAYSN